MKRFRLNQKGQSMVEFALVLPIILLVMLAILEGGRLVHAQFQVAHAAREGARSAAVGDGDMQVAQVVQLAAADLQQAQLATTITPTETNRVSGQTVQVTVSYTLDFISPIIGDILGNTIQVNSTTVMRVE